MLFVFMRFRLFYAVLGRRQTVQEPFSLKRAYYRSPVLMEDPMTKNTPIPKIIAAAAFLAAGLAAMPAQAATGDANCIAPINFWSWKAVDNRTVILTDRSRHDYKISLAPGCFDIAFNLNIGVKSFSTSRLQCISRGDQLIVPAGGGSPTQYCMIQSIDAYTPEMAHADAMAKAAMSQKR